MRTRARWVGVAVTLAMAVAPRLAGASSSAGIRIEIGKHTLEVLYSVAIDYPEQRRAIRDPSDALFSLAALIQAKGQISFGSFPSSSLNKGWALLPPKAGAKGIVVTREGMRKHFGLLD